MRMKNDAKLKEELNWQFKIDLNNWWTLSRALENVKNLNFKGYLC